MKTLANKILVTVTLLTVIATTAYSQTTVSGGIYANTTWTLANSPYIVTARNKNGLIKKGKVVKD